jgi:hypothetical protein
MKDPSRPKKKRGRAVAKSAQAQKSNASTSGKIYDTPRGFKYETPRQLIARLAKEFYPLNVHALAAACLANDRPFPSHAFVMLVTRRWREARSLHLKA